MLHKFLALFFIAISYTTDHFSVYVQKLIKVRLSSWFSYRQLCHLHGNNKLCHGPRSTPSNMKNMTQEQRELTLSSWSWLMAAFAPSPSSIYTTTINSHTLLTSPINITISPIANLKGHYFQSSLSVSLCVCLCVCLWPALLPFNVDRFWRNLVTRTLLWSSLAATIMVQIGRRGTVRRLFENYKKKSQKSQNLNFKILVRHFYRATLC